MVELIDVARGQMVYSYYPWTRGALGRSDLLFMIKNCVCCHMEHSGLGNFCSPACRNMWPDYFFRNVRNELVMTKKAVELLNVAGPF